MNYDKEGSSMNARKKPENSWVVAARNPSQKAFPLPGRKQNCYQCPRVEKRQGQEYLWQNNGVSPSDVFFTVTLGIPISTAL